MKTVISLRLTKNILNHHIIFLFYHTESAISHQQREPVIQLKRPFMFKTQDSYNYSFFFVVNFWLTVTETNSLENTCILSLTKAYWVY